MDLALRSNIHWAIHIRFGETINQLFLERVRELRAKGNPRWKTIPWRTFAEKARMSVEADLREMALDIFCPIGTPYRHKIRECSCECVSRLYEGEMPAIRDDDIDRFITLMDSNFGSRRDRWIAFIERCAPGFPGAYSYICAHHQLC